MDCQIEHFLQNIWETWDQPTSFAPISLCTAATSQDEFQQKWRDGRRRTAPIIISTSASLSGLSGSELGIEFGHKMQAHNWHPANTTYASDINMNLQLSDCRAYQTAMYSCHHLQLICLGVRQSSEHETFNKATNTYCINALPRYHTQNTA